ncbi:MAG TPA: hypothetical protein VG796_30145 [Verrucomicrobiales bacterium]|nr:hypothetical protein [Verrucomicrobiales bacterium]
MEALFKIIIEDILAFAYCEDGEGFRDYCVSQLERISYDLKSADKAVIEAFIAATRSMAAEAAANGDKARAERIALIPEHSGLLPDSAETG